MHVFDRLKKYLFSSLFNPFYPDLRVTGVSWIGQRQGHTLDESLVYIETNNHSLSHSQLGTI